MALSFGFSVKACRLGALGSALAWGFFRFGLAGREFLPGVPLLTAFVLADALQVYALSCLAFFATASLRADGWLRFLLAFAPVVAFSVIVPFRVRVDVLDSFALADAVLALPVAGVGLVRSWRLESRQVRGAGAGPAAELLRHYRISAREAEVVALLLEGRTNPEIAESLFVSLSTVKTHLASVYLKTGVKNRVSLVRLFDTVPVADPARTGSPASAAPGTIGRPDDSALPG